MNNALYNQIRIFQSIAREGNISAAARKLEITPPSVSNALKLLEEYIGHKDSAHILTSLINVG